MVPVAHKLLIYEYQLCIGYVVLQSVEYHENKRKKCYWHQVS